MKLTIHCLVEVDGATSDTFARERLEVLESKLENVIAGFLLGQVDSFGIDLSARAEV